MGDGIQAAKAGILEVGDVFVVNKADREGADATARELRQMISLGEARAPGDWRPPVIQSVASRGEGIDEVMAALDEHRDWLGVSGALRAGRVRRAAAEIEAITLNILRSRIEDPRKSTALDDVAGQVVDGAMDPYAAADVLVEAVTLR